jgi:hypothetical protein
MRSQNILSLVELKERATLELSHRLSQTLVELYELSDHRDHQKLAANSTTTEVKETVELFANGSGPGIKSLYSEFSGMSTRGVAAEVRRRVGKTERVPLDQVIASLSGIDSTLDDMDLKNPQNVAGKLLKIMNEGFDTGNTYFYFVDCPPDSPFC